MPPLRFSTSDSVHRSGSEPSERDIIKRSSNYIGREFEARRAYEVLRAAGDCYTDGRILLKITCAKGVNESSYV